MKTSITTGSKITDEKHYPIHISSLKYPQLLAFQSYPERKIFFKGKEVTDVELVTILEKAKL